MPSGKIRAKVGNFGELMGICVKKSGDFWTNEAGQRAKRGKHFAILAVLDEIHFAIVAVFARKNFAILAVISEKDFAKTIVWGEKKFKK